MKRRAFLAMIALGAGCLDRGETTGSSKRTTVWDGTPSPTAVPTTERPTATTTEADASEPTVRPTTTQPELAVAQRLAFGEWYTEGDFARTVESIELTTTVEADFYDIQGEYELPPEEQLLIINIVLKNVSRESQYTRMLKRWGAVVGSDVYKEVESLEGVLEDETLDLDWLTRTDRRRRRSGHIEVGSGAKAKLWVGVVVPRSVQRGDLEVAFNTFGDSPYAIRWVQ